MTAARLYACPNCGRPTPTRGRCNQCPPTRRQLTTTQRGYGTNHQARRRALLTAAIGTNCPLCTQPMLATQKLELDHTQPLSHDPTSTGDRIVHATCNNRRGNRVETP